MRHLTFDDLTAFAALSELNKESAAFAAKVTEHIRECSHCRKLAAAVMQVSDALLSQETTTEKKNLKNTLDY